MTKGREGMFLVKFSRIRSADREVPEFDGLVVASGHDVEVVELEAGHSVGVRSGIIARNSQLKYPNLDSTWFR